MLKNKKILLTVQLGGRLGATVSNSKKKYQIKKTVSGIKLKIPIKSSNDFVAREILPCYKKTLIPETAVNYFISNDGIVPRVNQKHWLQMSENQRLQANLRLNAEGNPFTYEVL